MSPLKKIILYDGICGFCQKNVQFIIKRDPYGHFQFASLQSPIGQALLNKHQIPNELDSLILIDGEKWFDQSSAALRICKDLTGIWKVFFPLLIFPKSLRDLLYRFIANNRYRLFRTETECILPTPEMKKRFLEEEL